MSEPNLRDDDPEIMSDDPFVRETDDEMKQAREEEAAYDRARYIALSRPGPSKPLTPTELDELRKSWARHLWSACTDPGHVSVVRLLATLDATQAVEPTETIVTKAVLPDDDALWGVLHGTFHTGHHVQDCPQPERRDIWIGRFRAGYGLAFGLDTSAARSSSAPAELK